jgi:hypothetical protein
MLLICLENEFLKNATVWQSSGIRIFDFGHFRLQLFFRSTDVILSAIPIFEKKSRAEKFKGIPLFQKMNIKLICFVGNNSGEDVGSEFLKKED